jgi:hypothetical protein
MTDSAGMKSGNPSASRKTMNRDRGAIAGSIRKPACRIVGRYRRPVKFLYYDIVQASVARYS